MSTLEAASVNSLTNITQGAHMDPGTSSRLHWLLKGDANLSSKF